MTLEVKQLERLVALLVVGITVAVQRGSVTTAEAGHLLFSPHTMALLRKCRARGAVVDLIHTATEIEDIESLIPNQMEENLQKLLEEALACIETEGDYDFNAPKWLVELTR